MLKKFFKWIALELRPLKKCEGVGCYVWTPYRADNGRPYCSCCKEEGAKMYE